MIHVKNNFVDAPLLTCVVYSWAKRKVKYALTYHNYVVGVVRLIKYMYVHVVVHSLCIYQAELLREVLSMDRQILICFNVLSIEDNFFVAR